MKWIVCLVVMSVLSAKAPAAERMNVLFIVVDDLRPALGCYGDRQAITPNVDALAKRGMIFERAYCQQAVCSPSRTSLLTGLRPDTTKVYDLETHFRKALPDVVTLPQVFKNNGWHAQGFGKVYHGGLNDEASWSVPWTANRAPQYGSKEILAKLKGRGADEAEQGGKTKGPAVEIADVEDGALPDGWVADRAIAAMREVKDKPFFLAVGLIKPHLPFVAPRKYFDLHPLEKIELSRNPYRPKDAPAIAMTNFGEMRAYTDIPKGNEPISEAQARALIRGYYASTSYMDAQVGRVMAELDALGLREKTIVILWGDHGWHFGDQGLWCKHTNFEVATHAPLILSVPGMKHAGEKTSALVEFVDVYPTLCELTGVKAPEGLEGDSFLPVVEDPNRAWKSAAFSQYPRQGKKVMGYSMRTDRWRYTEWREGENVIARELYDEKEDAGETVNVAESKSDVVRELREKMRAGWRGSRPHG